MAKSKAKGSKKRGAGKALTGNTEKARKTPTRTSPRKRAVSEDETDDKVISALSQTVTAVEALQETQKGITKILEGLYEKHGIKV